MSVSLNTVHWSRLAKKALQGDLLTQEEALSVLQADDEEALPILQAAFQVRKHFYGKKVKLNMIINAKAVFARRIAVTAPSPSCPMLRLKSTPF